MTDTNTEALLQRIEQLNRVGIALSAERDINRVLELIVVEAKSIVGAEGGSLYRMLPDTRELRLEIMRNKALGLATGGTTGQPVPFDPIPLFEADGRPNKRNVVTSAVHEDRAINIQDAYADEHFDFSGTRAFDAQTGYCSRSFLTIPMRNHEHDIIGVLQLINARDPQTGGIGTFSLQDQHLAESLASQAAVALTNHGLIDELKHLFDALVKLIATAIDEKSPHTGGHCKRVPALTMMLAEAAHRTQDGALRDFALSAEERYQLEVAGWLHDCGKITTPEHVMDKSTKLEGVLDRIELIDTRFAVLKREAELARLRTEVEALRAGRTVDNEALDGELTRRLGELDEQREFLHRCNVGGESMATADRARVRALAVQRWHDADGLERSLLSADETEHLTIPKGTLSREEREIVNQHIVSTIKMLESLPFPKHLKNVPEYAGGHHEHIDGTGYPRGLTGEQMSIPARVMAIADVFEALTDGGRPYKEGMPLSRALAILGRMKLDRHIDPDLFDVFVREKVYLDYARAYLDPNQIDAIDPTAIPGFPA